MNLFEAALTFTMTWWLIFFMALPFGVQPDAHPVEGQDPGAPGKPRLLIKAAITTVLAGLATYAIHLVVASGAISFRP